MIKIDEIVSLVDEAATNLSAMMDTPAAKELGVRHALPDELGGCALMLRDETQTLRAEKEWLYAENERLRDAVRSARADEAHCWARRVETLTAKVQATDERCTQLLQSMASARAMQPAPAITVAVDALPGMSPMNRTIAYCAAGTLRKLGYAWNGEAWVGAEPQGEPVALPDWPMAKTFKGVADVVATLECAKTGREQTFIHMAACWVAAYLLKTTPPQQRKPLTDTQIDLLWIQRDCIAAIQEGDILAQVRSVVRAVERAYHLGAQS